MTIAGLEDIRDMSDEELKLKLEELRLQRKKGYEKKPRVSKKRAKSELELMIEGLGEEVAQQILKELNL